MDKYLIQLATKNLYQATIQIASVQDPHRSKNHVRNTHTVCSDWSDDLQYQEVNLDVLSAHVSVDVHLS